MNRACCVSSDTKNISISGVADVDDDIIFFFSVTGGIRL